MAAGTSHRVPQSFADVIADYAIHSRIKITNFRSLTRVELKDVDNIVPIVGPNGSGKSNMLRALNLFFNGEVENGVPVDLGRDFHDPELKRKTKKVIEVQLDMHFGSGLRSDLQQPIDKLAGGNDIVTLRKRWSLDKVTREPIMELSFGAAGTEPDVLVDWDRTLVERLLSSIRFRYISNHVHPTDLLRQEEENIRRGLFRRLGKSPSFSADQIEKIREAAESLMSQVTDELKGSTTRISNVELGTPTDWGELLWAFGLRMQTGSAGGREANLHGSGIQSALAYAMLHMLDISLGSDFGWRRGAIWAVEEPESFLHADLQDTCSSLRQSPAPHNKSFPLRNTRRDPTADARPCTTTRWAAQKTPVQTICTALRAPCHRCAPKRDLKHQATPSAPTKKCLRKPLTFHPQMHGSAAAVRALCNSLDASMLSSVFLRVGCRGGGRGVALGIAWPLVWSFLR
ncbi:MAG TPA: AAA family ATPase [Solirubrobacteraceae bacterium]